MLMLMPAAVGNSHVFSYCYNIVSGKRLMEVVGDDKFIFGRISIGQFVTRKSVSVKQEDYLVS